MDKLARYRDLIKGHLSRIAEIVNRRPTPEMDFTPIFDEENDAYLLFNTGWFQRRRVCAPTLYVRIKEGKIWIELDLTEDGIGNALLRAGVPKEDIVLGFLSPDQRQYAEFAVA